MMWSKSCPRCHGDLFLDSDLREEFVNCLQCGAALTESQVRLLRLPQRRLPVATVGDMGIRVGKAAPQQAA